MFPRSGVVVFCVFTRCFQRAASTALNSLTVPDLVQVFGRLLIIRSRSSLDLLPPNFRLAHTGSMPRKEKVKGQPAKAGGGAAETRGSGPVTRDRSGAVTITVHVKPGSKHSSITDVSAEAVGVSIAAPPTDGEANTELIRYLAEVLDLKKSHVSLDKGSRSRDKLIRVDSSLSPEEVLRRLQQAAG